MSSGVGGGLAPILIGVRDVPFSEGTFWLEENSLGLFCRL